MKNYLILILFACVLLCNSCKDWHGELVCPNVEGAYSNAFCNTETVDEAIVVSPVDTLESGAFLARVPNSAQDTCEYTIHQPTDVNMGVTSTGDLYFEISQYLIDFNARNVEWTISHTEYQVINGVPQLIPVGTVQVTRGLATTFTPNCNQEVRVSWSLTVGPNQTVDGSMYLIPYIPEPE